MNEGGNEDHSQQFFVHPIAEEEEPPSQFDVLRESTLSPIHHRPLSLNRAHRAVPREGAQLSQASPGSSEPVSIGMLPPSGGPVVLVRSDDGMGVSDRSPAASTHPDAASIR